LTVSIFLLIAFVINETKVKYPLVPLRIFRIRNVTGGNLIMLPIVAGALGQGFFLTLYLQNILNYTPVQTGLSFLPVPIIIGYISRKAPSLIEKYGFKPLLIAGTSITTIAVFMFSFLTVESTYLINILPAFLLMAVGFGLSFVSITVAATAGVPADESGLASGLINTSQQIGGALGLAILAVVATTAIATAQASGQTLVQASLYGYQQVFVWAAGMMLSAILVAIFVIQVPPAPTKK
ncbi:MAG: MFS transporter, partial [Candidatus Levybacteria bacterium]|nr:MFS transporter [Candidatus Levybacteria bacterium]